ncbi:MAG TPA: radical SAM-associated putative lipoprotein [Bacteroidales bacterium]|nr:radical SAM-associated putative lipoprotein [Bacteroidales bacterium]HKM12829.1 radical SAM-associated putative lipoprotein [Bacteroidales bacterium]HPB88531.1 radical SAM-associated putative lipoprotein [Bacteroidales bacterium]HPY21428.1 radical SAM-associated putative lipoprotein [Bacteroidales bacterium]HQA92486.1 radical SAM-associated putative lipoprotein [Bacteroidales bacterium]
MKRKLFSIKSNWVTRILAIIFPSIILSGCPICMYGSPYATYTTRGQVTNEEGKALKGIRVSVADYTYTDPQGNELADFIDSALTDSRGGYLIDNLHLETYRLIVVAKDIDGEEEGGEYQSDTIVVDDFDFKGGDGWYSGHADVKVDFQLKKK